MHQPKVVAILLAGLALAPSTASAELVARDTVEAWLVAPPPAAMPAPGAVLGAADLPAIRSVVAPGYYERMDHPELVLEIQATGDYRPHPVYQAATAAHGSEAALQPDGGLRGYVAGRPFDPQRFDDVSPEEAGMMIAWNHVYRWQYYGYALDTLDMIYVQPTADGEAGTLVEGMLGGGHVERSMVQEYHRVYLNHLAMLPDQGYRVDASNSDERYFKEYITFHDPFDVKGTTFVVERALDPNEEDQVNSYLPTQRRVRRLSARERADSFMGSNFTLDDFEGFSGRVMDYVWIYRGQKDVLHVADSKGERLAFGGRMSDVAIDRWQLRPTFVVELVPRWEGHPMSAKLLLVDQQTYTPTMALVFDREGQLWRYIMPHYKRPVRDESSAERSLETSTSRWRGSVAVDFKAGTSTLARATSETVFPTMTEKQIERKFSLSNLTEGR